MQCSASWCRHCRIHRYVAATHFDQNNAMVLPLYNRGYHEVKIFIVLAFCQNLVFIEKNARYLLYLNTSTKTRERQISAIFSINFTFKIYWLSSLRNKRIKPFNSLRCFLCLFAANWLKYFFKLNLKKISLMEAQRCQNRSTDVSYRRCSMVIWHSVHC